MSRETRDFALGYLASKGVPAHVAAGIVGNLAIESGNFSKDVISGKKAGDKGISKYAGQWNKERLDNYEAFAKATGRHPSDFTAQLDFIAEEMNPASPYADPQAVKGAAAVFGAQTPEEAAQAFQDHYERPNQQYANTKGRQAIAVQSYEAYLSGPVTGAPTPYGRTEDPIAGAPQIASAQEPAQAQADYSSPLGMFGDRVTSPMGGRVSPMGIGSTNHQGVDMTAALGRGQVGYPAQTVAPGVVSFAGPARGYGNMVEITHDDGTRTRYAHLEQINPSLAVDMSVAQGIPVGTVGSTGISSAPHLHFEMIDPLGNRLNPANVIDFAQNRTVPTPTPAQRAPTQLAGNVLGIAPTVTPTTSIPGAAPAFTAASDFGINMGAPGQLAGVPASMVQSTTIAPGAQMAGLSQPSAPSARSAQEQSMAALSQAAAPSIASAPQSGPSARSAQEASMDALAAAPTIASAPQAGPSARSAEEMSMAALSAQPSYAPSPRSAQDYSMAAFAPSAPAQTATEALDALAGPEDEQIDMGSWGQVAQAAPQSINIAQAPAIAPVQAPVAPAPAPVAYSAPAPVSRAPTPSMPSGLDFWGGKANVAVSNSGAQLSRDIHGNTYNYSPSYDVTTISNSLGDVIGTQQGKVSIDTTGKATGGKGLFSGGIFGDDGVFGDTFSKGGVQNAVVGGLGGLGGSIVGGMVGGPIGGLVGSALGRSLAQSRFGVPAVNPMAITPQQMAAALASYSSGLGFPDAPTGGAGWGGWVDGSGPGSRGYAESISPGAADAIDAGKGGLY